LVRSIESPEEKTARTQDMTKSTRASAGAVFAAGIGVFLGAHPAFAQREGSVTVEVGECLEIEAPAERLACFERRAEGARRSQQSAPAAPSPPAAAPSPPAATPPAPVARTPAATPPAAGARAPTPADDDSFGRSPPQPSRREARQAREAQEAQERDERTELTAKVVAIRETIPNSYTITLDNGQIWRQNRPEFYPIRPGHDVRIYPGRMGESYRLTVPILRGWIQVERVR
jgi:hypothetical protein